MLVRVLFVVESDSLADRLLEVLAPLDVDARRIPVRRRRGPPWPGVGRSAGDVVLLSRKVLPDPPEPTLEFLRGLPEEPSIVVLTGDENAEDRARLVAVGADAVLHTGVGDQILSEALGQVIARRRSLEGLAAQEAQSAPSAPRLSDFVLESRTMAAFMETVSRVASSNASLLILGETGVGKEHLARGIHGESPRSEAPFIAVNCGAIPDALLESELFGHEEGSFTGAVRSRKGWFEQAHTGTLFLDEVAELPLHLQVKLLRVLQFREVRRVGSERDIPIDVRIIAATNRDIDDEVAAKRFRSDLYYRLSVITLSIPPLRERPEDIPALAERLSQEIAQSLGRRVVPVSLPALASLSSYHWPGNVRELANVLERAALLCEADEIGLADLPEPVVGGGAARVLAGEASGAALPADLLAMTLKEARGRVVEELERSYIAGVLGETGGRIGAAALRAGVDPRSLYNKMRRYGLRKEDFRDRSESEISTRSESKCLDSESDSPPRRGINRPG